MGYEAGSKGIEIFEDDWKGAVTLDEQTSFTEGAAWEELRTILAANGVDIERFGTWYLHSDNQSFEWQSSGDCWEVG